MSERFYVLSPRFFPQDPCFCKSGKLFGACCGNPEPQRQPPAGISIINGFLGTAACSSFIEFAEQRQGEALAVYDADNSVGQNVAQKQDSVRKTQTIALGQKEAVVTDWVRRACLEVIQPRFGARLEWFELPYVLRYGPGDLYGMHSDAEHLDAAARKWYRVVDRDISILMYLNDGYEGGGLRFKHFNYTYQPKAGDLVLFPSSNVYMHESIPVVSGSKYALASWGALTGSPRVQAPPSPRIFL